MTVYCSIGAIAAKYGVSTSTIRRWAARGLICIAHRTMGGHRRFILDEDDEEDPGKRKVVGYARVSSHDQKSDLGRQVERLRDAGCEEVITDIGSGLNCRKPGLRALMRRLLERRVSELVLVHEDRLLRFGTALVRFICGRVKTVVRILEERQDVSFEEELARDVVTLMTVFCARLYGRRSRRRKGTVVQVQPASQG
ncbi:IS607 family transposase [Sutterella sp.]|uniref:IS607 family transposase n=1 Tax=Sutterella sp. TaxID=1981025 RepID=UPI003FD7F1A7